MLTMGHTSHFPDFDFSLIKNQKVKGGPRPRVVHFGTEKSPYRDQKRARGPFSAPVGEIIIAPGDGVAMAALVGGDRYA